MTASACRAIARVCWSRRLAFGVIAALGSVASGAVASEPPPTLAEPAASAASIKDQVLGLYNQGKELLDGGRTAEACQAFEAAKRLDSTALNLLLRLGDCYERLGRTASAYGEYQTAASLAAAANDPRRRNAEERLAAVEPRLARVTLAVAPGLVGVTVRRNGDVIAGDQLGKPAPVDPGRYTFEAAAPGKRAWSTAREIAPGAVVTIEVPVLDPLVSAAPRAPIPPPDATSSPRRVVGIALGAVGLIGLGVGAGFGVKAITNLQASKADGHCDAQSFCDDTGFQLRRDAQEAGTISSVTFALGATAAVAGAILWLTTPGGSTGPAKAPQSSSIAWWRAGVAGDARSGRVWLGGAF